MKTKLRDHNKQILLFCVIDLFLNFIIQFIWQKSVALSLPQVLTIIGIPFILTLVLVRTIDKLSRRDAGYVAAILMFCNCFSLIAVNVANPFHRIITKEEYQDGIIGEIMLHVIILLPISIALAMAFRKNYSSEKTDDNVLDDFEESEDLD